MKRLSIMILALCLFFGLMGGIALFARQNTIRAEEVSSEESQPAEVQSGNTETASEAQLPNMTQAPMFPAQPKDRSLNVTAQGKVKVDPDVAYLTLGVSERGDTAKEASDKANEAMLKIFAMMEEQGIDKKDLKTVNFYINPQQDWNANPPVIFAYQADNTIQITVRDVKKVGDILALALDAGANTVQDIRFDLLDKTEAYAEALKLAVQSAKAKAAVMAEAAGVTIDETPLALSEGNLSSYGYHIQNNRNFAPVEQEMAMDAAGIAVAENQLEITAFVEAIYLMH